MSVGHAELYVEMSPLCRIERGDDGNITLSAGQGAHRERVGIWAEPAFVRWLCSTVAPVKAADLEREVGDAAGLTDAGERRELVRLLLDASILVPSAEADRLRAQGATWEKWNWRDAFDFHFAGYGQPFELDEDGSYDRLFEEMLRTTDIYGEQPGAFKDVEHDAVVELRPHLVEAQQLSVEHALRGNVPVQFYPETGMTLGQLAYVLHTGFGAQRVVPSILGDHLRKTSPSGGARHPVEAYVVAKDVDGLDQGLYHYSVRHDQLHRMRGPEALENLDEICFQKGGIRTASATVFVTARWFRHSWKYRYSRSYRMVMMDLGHALQSARLAGGLAGLGVYYSPAVDDVGVEALLGIEDGFDESPIYALGLGREPQLWR